MDHRFLDHIVSKIIVSGEKSPVDQILISTLDDQQGAVLCSLAQAFQEPPAQGRRSRRLVPPGCAGCAMGCGVETQSKGALDLIRARMICIGV
jgi:hypothetical protein